jgi:hypothetical protein
LADGPQWLPRDPESIDLIEQLVKVSRTVLEQCAVHAQRFLVMALVQVQLSHRLSDEWP